MRKKISATPAQIVQSLFDYIEYMGCGAEGIPESEWMCNVNPNSNRGGISFDGYGSSPFIERERLESWLKETLKP